MKVILNPKDITGIQALKNVRKALDGGWVVWTNALGHDVQRVIFGNDHAWFRIGSGANKMHESVFARLLTSPNVEVWTEAPDAPEPVKVVVRRGAMVFEKEISPHGPWVHVQDDSATSIPFTPGSKVDLIAVPTGTPFSETLPEDVREVLERCRMAIVSTRLYDAIASILKKYPEAQ